MKRTLFSFIFSLCLSALGLWWIWHQLDSQQRQTSLIALPWWAFALACGSLVLSYFFAAWRLRIVAWKMNTHLGWLTALRAHVLGVFVSVLTPGGSGGHPAVALLLARNMPGAKATSLVLVILRHDILFFAWSMPLAVSLLNAGSLLPFKTTATVLSIVFFVFGLCLSFLLSSRLDLLEKLMRLCFRGFLLRFRRSGLRFAQEMQQANALLTSNTVALETSVHGLTVLSWLAFYTILTPLALAYAVDLQWPSLVSAQLTVGLIATFVPTPGGSGFVEIVLAQLVGSQRQAVSVLIFWWRLISHYSYFITGPLLAGPLITKSWRQSATE